jgi:hypothetical protein
MKTENQESQEPNSAEILTKNYKEFQELQAFGYKTFHVKPKIGRILVKPKEIRQLLKKLIYVFVYFILKFDGQSLWK